MKQNPETIPDYIALIGLKMPYGDHVCSYFDKLPDTFKLCTNFAGFYRLKEKKKVATKENLEPSYGTHYLVYSSYSEQYQYAFVSEHTNMNKLFKYFNDRNLYIFKEKEEVSTQLDESGDTILLNF